MVGIPPSSAGGTGLFLGRGTKIAHAIGCGQWMRQGVIFLKITFILKKAYYVSATGDTEEQKTGLCFTEL